MTERQKCRMTITVRGQYTLAGYVAGRGRIVWAKRAQCSRLAGPTGYCWQHAEPNEQSSVVQDTGTAD